jgi:hypothetical protein
VPWRTCGAPNMKNHLRKLRELRKSPEGPRQLPRCRVGPAIFHATGARLFPASPVRPPFGSADLQVRLMILEADRVAAYRDLGCSAMLREKGCDTAENRGSGKCGKCGNSPRHGVCRVAPLFFASPVPDYSPLARCAVISGARTSRSAHEHDADRVAVYRDLGGPRSRHEPVRGNTTCSRRCPARGDRPAWPSARRERLSGRFRRP